jgi:rfaE bifunctional protein kinase chain/domain
MTPHRLQALLGAFPSLRIAVVGDFCLDRYLEIDGLHQEVSIETGLPVYKVDRVRSQPGAAGTVLNNLVALGVGSLFPVGFYGEDGEGYELERALRLSKGVETRCFMRTAERRTFTYCKPLLIAPGALPRELSRLDSKNGSPTPEAFSQELAAMTRSLIGQVDAVAVMDQVDVTGTGVVTERVKDALTELSASVPVVADSRSGLGAFPPLIFKLNRTELLHLAGLPETSSREVLSGALEAIALRNARPAFVTLAEDGILGAAPGAGVEWVPSLPLRGPIDIVGAGDSVTAALAAALAAGASLREAMELAMLAASVTVHQIGTTGVAEAGAVLQVAGSQV